MLFARIVPERFRLTAVRTDRKVRLVESASGLIAIRADVSNLREKHLRDASGILSGIFA